MAFVMNGAPYNTNNTPIYSVDMDDNILGMAQNNGSILINKNVSPLELKKSKTVEHEMVHIDQMKRGDLDYTDTTVTWKGKQYPRSSMKEGSKKLPWEVEAYSKQNKTPLYQTKDSDVEKTKKRVKINEYVKKLNPKITKKQIDKAWKGIDDFEKLNKV